MEPKQKDYFSGKAANFDEQKATTQNVGAIGQLVINELSFSNDMHIMDFGSGTGLLLSQIAPFVKEITAVDISPSMTAVLQSKRDSIACELQIVEMDLTKETIHKKFDAIISSMTIHHIEDFQEIFNTFYSLLNENGTLAIADLDKEDGSFHSEDTGVFHNGFDRIEFLRFAEDAGFKDLKIQTASVMEKPTGTYTVFLLTGKK